MKKNLFLSMLGVYSFVSAMNDQNQQNQLINDLTVAKQVIKHKKFLKEQLEENQGIIKKMPEGIKQINSEFVTRTGIIINTEYTENLTKTKITNTNN